MKIIQLYLVVYILIGIFVNIVSEFYVSIIFKLFILKFQNLIFNIDIMWN